MKSRLLRGIRVGAVAVGLLLPLLLLAPHRTATVEPQPEAVQEEQPPSTEAVVKQYLESKQSPLAAHTEFLLQHEHWKLLIAVSAIESQFCKRKIDFNCWGIGGDSAYRHYKSYEEAITDAHNLIEKWHAKGRWLTVEDMNGSYVVPGNPNWVRVVNHTLEEIESELKSK